MIHDPLCPQPQCDDDCLDYERCNHRCQCRLIKQVRADEREKAAQQVPALFASAPFVYPTDIAAVEFAQDWLRRGGDPIDTVRGGS